MVSDFSSTLNTFTMQETTHYHGMTESAYNAFINSDEGKINGPWVCSQHDGVTYLHSKAKAEYEAEQSEQSTDDYCIQQAAESAIIQAALHGDKFIYVLHVNIPDDYAHIEDDYSCENMAGSADCIPAEDFKGFVHTVTKYRISPYFAPLILKLFEDRTYFDVSACTNTDVLECMESIDSEAMLYIDTELMFAHHFESEFTL